MPFPVQKNVFGTGLMDQQLFVVQNRRLGL